MEQWTIVSLPIFSKEVMTTKIKKEEELAADQIIIPKIGLSNAQWHFSDPFMMQLGFHTHVGFRKSWCHIPRVRSAREKMSVF